MLSDDDDVIKFNILINNFVLSVWIIYNIIIPIKQLFLWKFKDIQMIK
jgi:hypothetical protein